jgi:cytochrome c oxidase cbb3-type subunit III
MKWPGRLAGALLLALGACHEPTPDYAVVIGTAPYHRPDAGDAQHELGRRVYNFRCYYCHGYSGDARTLAAAYLSPPPRDFTATRPAELSPDAMLAAVRDGRPGTAMEPFAGILSAREMQAVVQFVRHEFMERRAPNTHYHTAANGWPRHERYRAAFPFVRGELALDTPWEQFSAEQQRGRRLYLSACISCHDRGRASPGPVVWEGRPVSYPRNGYRSDADLRLDAVSSASPYGLHGIPPRLASATAQERLGGKLFQANCAFCHAADGSGKNWIGSFMEPHPRNLTDPIAMAGMTGERLRRVIREGLPNTSMPAWKSVLEPPEIEAVIAYVSRAFHHLPGER